MTRSPARPVDAANPNDTTADEIYGRRRNDQYARLTQRLRRRQVTWRKLAIYAAAVVLLIFAQPQPVTFAVGAVLIASGLLMRLWTFGHLQKNQMLITSGPYAHTRNPAYFGSALVLTGLVFAAGNALSVAGLAIWGAGVVGLAVFFLVYLPRKYKREYKRLANLFPGDYQRHAAHVPHFLPRLTPWRDADNRRFSWACLRANHELVWPLICVAALGLMWVG